MKDKKYYLNLAKEAAKILDGKKAENIVIYDVESKTGLYYYAIITNSLSSQHLEALEEEVVKRFKKDKEEYLLYRDGITSNLWKALDYGGLVIHIFEKETREFYGLDKIYNECKKVRWQIKKKKTVLNRKKKV